MQRREREREELVKTNHSFHQPEHTGKCPCSPRLVDEHTQNLVHWFCENISSSRYLTLVVIYQNQSSNTSRTFASTRARMLCSTSKFPSIENTRFIHLGPGWCGGPHSMILNELVNKHKHILHVDKVVHSWQTGRKNRRMQSTTELDACSLEHNTKSVCECTLTFQRR